MALLRYLKPKDGLPDPKDSLSLTVPSRAIARANQEVEEAMSSKEGEKGGPYGKYSPHIHVRAEYASNHGVAAAA